MSSPDRSADGLVSFDLNPLRYDGQSDEPTEVAGILQSLMPRDARVLDVGCGTGSVTVIANAGKGNQVLCVEPDPDRAAVARSRGLEVVTGILDEDFLENHGKFDVVMASDVLEHLSAPAELLDHFRSAIAPRGRLLISVPNVAHWSVRAQLATGRWNYEEFGIMDSTHLRWFTQATITALLNNNGFTVGDVRVTAGADLPVYGKAPLNRISRRRRVPMIQAGLRTLPRLFAAQYVVAARVNPSS